MFETMMNDSKMIEFEMREREKKKFVNDQKIKPRPDCDQKVRFPTLITKFKLP